jgi:hypothetical protein
LKLLIGKINHIHRAGDAACNRRRFVAVTARVESQHGYLTSRQRSLYAEDKRFIFTKQVVKRVSGQAEIVGSYVDKQFGRLKIQDNVQNFIVLINGKTPDTAVVDFFLYTLDSSAFH